MIFLKFLEIIGGVVQFLLEPFALDSSALHHPKHAKTNQVYGAVTLMLILAGLGYAYLS